MSDLADDILADVLVASLAAEDAEQLLARPAPSLALIERAQGHPQPNLRAMLDEQCAADPDRQPWPDAWFELVDSGQAGACQRLWAAALVAIIKDALVDDEKFCRKQKKPRGSAMGYVRTRDFGALCALAGFEAAALVGPLTDPARIPAIEEALFTYRGGVERWADGSRRGNA